MAYLNEDGLARYDGLIKNWTTFKSGTVDGIDPLLNWQKTETAGAVAFYPLPAAPIDPTVNFLFTETGPAEGEKAPDNPSTITGVSSVKVTRCGKNLLSYPYYSSSFTSNDVTFTVASDGTVATSGTASGDVDFYIASSSNGPWLSSGLSYTLSGCPSGGSTSTYYMRHSAYPTAADTGSGATFTASASGKPAQPIIIRIKSGTNTNNLVFRPQLELGSAATSFEPYEGADYTVNLGGTFYGGSVDLSTGVMTVTWVGEYVSTITNTELVPNYVRTTLAVTYGHMGSGSAPTYFRSNYDDNGTYVYPRYSAGTARISISLPYEMLGLDPSTATEQTAKSAVESFLAQHPCFVVYKLYTPQTISLAPTQIYSLSQPDPYAPRINTVYSDQVSVQVGYPKSPQATSTELTNAIISLGGEI